MPVFTTTIQQGCIENDIRKRIWSWLKNCRDGKRVRIELSPVKNTLPQQKYYFSVIVKMFMLKSLDDGEVYNEEQMHDVMMRHPEIGNYEIKRTMPDGMVMTTRRSYKDLSTEESEQYHERCRAFAALWWSLEIPLPREELRKAS